MNAQKPSDAGTQSINDAGTQSVINANAQSFPPTGAGNSSTRRWFLGLAVALLCLLGAGLLGLISGSVAIPLDNILGALRGDESVPYAQRTIVLDLRLPRVLLGMMVGASLALAGCGFQSIMRNPLADPYIVGTSAGASLGVAVAIVLHLPAPVSWLSPLPFFAFLGALSAMLAVYCLSRVRGTLPMDTFLLAGVVVGSFAGAMVSFLMTIAGNDLQNLLAWLMGSLAQADYHLISLAAPYMALGGAILLGLASSLNLMGLGEESAQSLGLNVERFKLLVIAAGALVTAAAVASAGLIGFVGLFIPHIARILVGPDHRILLPVAALSGAAFLVLADLAARTLAAPRELPVGVLTALIGAPFFFWLLRSRRRNL